MQEIICVLDKSGSMYSVREEAISGLNSFLEEQKKVGEANLTLVWFDNGFSIGYEGLLSEAPPVEEWPNGGMTSLRDAIGKTFAHVHDRFSREHPEKVVMAILTDGQDNTSHEFTIEAVKSLIDEHEDKYGWDVVFLAANQDAWAVGQHYGIKFDKAHSYDSSNTRGGFATLSSQTSLHRKK